MLYEYIIFIFHDIYILCVGQLWPALQYRNWGNCLHVLSTVQLNMAPWIFLCPAESRTLAFSMQLNTDYTSEGSPIGEERNDRVVFK